MMWWGDSWGAGAWIAMSLTMLVFWGGLVALVVFLVRDSRTERGGTRADDSRRADEVLAERFARGEIDADEYAQRRDLLHQR